MALLTYGLPVELLTMATTYYGYYLLWLLLTMALLTYGLPVELLTMATTYYGLRLTCGAAREERAPPPSVVL